MPLPRTSTLNFLKISGILILTFLIYFQAISQSRFLNWDDDLYLTKNKEIQENEGWYRIWVENKMPNPYPITFSVLRLEYLWFGLDPVAFHWGNLILHLINIVLFALFLHKVKVPSLAASFSVAVYALHPVQVETVMWISEVKNLLSAGFYWGSWLAFLHYLEGQAERKRYYWLGLSMFIFSLASKSMTVTLPVSLSLWLWFFHRSNFKSLFLRFLPLWFLSLAFGLLSIHSENKFYNSGHLPILNRSFIEKLEDVAEATFFYLWKFLFPEQLSCVYPQNPFFGGSVLRSVAPLFLGIILAFLAFKTLHSENTTLKKAFFSIWNVGLVMGPILGFLSTSYMSLSKVSDRYFYHSIPFLVLGASLFLTERFKTNRLVSRGISGSFFIFLIVLLPLTYSQTFVWKDPISLWERASLVAKNHPIPFYNLGVSYWEESAFDNAENAYKKTLLVDPYFYRAYSAYGYLLMYQGKLEAGDFFLKQADLYYPKGRSHFIQYLLKNPEFGQGWEVLGTIYKNLQNNSQAITYYEKARTVRYPEKKSLVILGELYLAKHQYELAKQCFLEAIEENIETTRAHQALQLLEELEKKN